MSQLANYAHFSSLTFRVIWDWNIKAVVTFSCYSVTDVKHVMLQALIDGDRPSLYMVESLVGLFLPWLICRQPCKHETDCKMSLAWHLPHAGPFIRQQKQMGILGKTRQGKYSAGTLHVNTTIRCNKTVRDGQNQTPQQRGDRTVGGPQSYEYQYITACYVLKFWFYYLYLQYGSFQSQKVQL